MRGPAGTLGARRPIRFRNADHKGEEFASVLDRGHPRPNLLDWDRDGHTDLVVGQPWDWALHIARGPLDPEKALAVKRIPLPEPLGLTGVLPQYFQFADWDGDGCTDLLIGAQLPPEGKDGLRPWAVYWLRNTAPRGEPRYAVPLKLLDIPTPWILNGIAIDDSPGPGRQHLVASAYKDWRRNADGNWSIVSQLWRYRREADPRLAADGPGS